MIDKRELGVILENRPYNLLNGTRTSLGELTDIFHKSIGNDTVLVASYGDLNITAWVATTIALANSSDVLVCLPSQRFDALYQTYTNQFYKLTRKDDPSHNGTFAYLSILWGKGRINEESESIEDIEIESRPKLGKSSFKDAYEKYVISELSNPDGMSRKPKIIFVKYDFSLPKLNNQGMTAIFRNHLFPLQTINPKTVIIESANEIGYRSMNIMPDLIKNLQSSGIKTIIHFSWPYLKGIQTLYRTVIDQVEGAAVIHLGNNLCKTLRKNSPSRIDGALLPFTIEGDRGDYFSINHPPTFQMIMPPDGFLVTPTIEEVAGYQNEYDDILRDMRAESSRLGSDDYYLKGLLLFPPFVDSFALPSELTAPTVIDGYGYRNLPVSDYLMQKLGEDKSKGLRFSVMADGLQKSCDISLLIQNIRTHAQITKRTMVQLQIIRLIGSRLFSDPREGDIAILLADLHPLKGTGKSTNLMVSQLARSLSELLKGVPSVIWNNHEGALMLTTQKGEFCLNSSTVAEMQGVIKFLRSDNGIGDRFNAEFDPDEETITISKPIPKGLISYEKEGGNWKGLNRSAYKFNLMVMSRIQGGGWRIQRIDDVGLNQNSSTISIKSSSNEYDGMKIKKKCDEFQIFVERQDFSRLSNLPLEKISKTHVLIPGPVPMLSIGDEIRISEGFDSLLLPFKGISFFVYPGRNAKRLLAQTKVFEKLFSDQPNEISDADLNISLEMNNRIPPERRPPSKPIKNIELAENPGDSPIDILVKNGQYSDDGQDSKDKRELITLRDIFRKIGTAGGRKSPGDPPSPSRSTKESIVLRILLADGSESTISISKGTIVRVQQDGEFPMRRVNEVGVGDIILYLSINTMEGIDEYLIRDYAEENSISLDLVYEAFDSLGKFITALGKIRMGGEDKHILDRLDWLTESEKESLFKFIQYALGSDQYTGELDSVVENLIWREYLNLEDPMEFRCWLHGKFDICSAYEIAKTFGLSLQQTTFEQYCGYAKNKVRHYYFKDYGNIEAIGKLTGNKKLIEDAESINEMGKRLTPLMIAIGRSISRVISKDPNENNPMDVLLNEKLIKCQVLEIRS